MKSGYLKLNANQINRLAFLVLEQWKKNGIIAEFKTKEDVVTAKIVETIKKDFEKEVKLEQDALKMVDDLEKKHTGEFQRHKMFQMVKQRLAAERKIIL